MTKALEAIGFSCGGESGARLAKRLAMPVSPDCLLRIIRNAVLPTAPTPRVLGVDDWAFRRGLRYGTILCDLERRCPVDLLPDRSSQGFADWLKSHPGVEIISRDRGDFYIKGATEGAPSAQQVADRWHLLKNLREALVRLVDRHAVQLREAVRSGVKATSSTTLDLPSTLTDPPEEVCKTEVTTCAEQLSQQRRQRRLDLYQQVVQLREQGVSVREIARRLKIHRRTVRRYLKPGGFPERC